MKNITCPFYILFQVLKVLLVKICKIQTTDLLFLVIFISFYISAASFFTNFQNFNQHYLKKDFCHRFSFFKWIHSPSPPHPLNAQNPLSMTKVFCQCSPYKSNVQYLFDGYLNMKNMQFIIILYKTQLALLCNRIARYRLSNTVSTKTQKMKSFCSYTISLQQILTI